LLDKAIAANPENLLAIQEKANMLHSEENFKEADEEYNKAYNLIQRNPILSDSILFDSAINSESMGDTSKAIITYEKLLISTESEPIRKIAIQSLIRIFDVLGEKEKVEYYKELLNKLP
jgi:tetratricopeptide (TPR) repeat protein